MISTYTKQEEALWSYVGTGHNKINAGLRAGYMFPRARYLDELMQPIPYDLTVYRAMSLDEVNGYPKIGSELTQLGFMSTSLDSEFKFGLARDKAVWAELEVPAGTEGIFVSDLLTDRKGHIEREVLLRRGLRWCIVSSRSDRALMKGSLKRYFVKGQVLLG